MMGGLYQRLFLLGGSMVVAFLLGEVVLRTLGYYGAKEGRVEQVRLVSDDVLDFRQVEGASWFRDGHHFEINKHGWRDYEYDYNKADNSFRVVVLGDSVTHGYGVAVDEIYAKRLEAKLTSGTVGMRYEVIMLTVGALNTAQEAHLLKVEGLKYQPDLVVVGYVLNDPATGASLRQAREARKSLLHEMKRTLAHSSLLHLTYSSWQKLVWRYRVWAGREEVADYIESDYFSRLHSNEDGWSRVLSGMDSIGEACRERGIPVVWVIFPVLHEFETYRWKWIHELVGNAAVARGFNVLDLLESFRGYNARELQVDSGDHVHPNPLGHRVAAEALMGLLRDENLLP